MNVFLEKRGFTDDSVLHDPIYCGQVRVIPADQLKEACAWLRQKIATESTIRPEQMERYQDTLRMLSDRLRDGQGTESIPLTEADAKALAILAKEGGISAEKLKLLGVSADEMIHFEYLAKQAFKSGLTAATISVVLNVAPEVYKAIDHLIKSGELDAKQFQRIGFAALKGGSEGFVRGSVSAAITIDKDIAKSSSDLLLIICNFLARRSTENRPMPFSPNFLRPFGVKGLCTLLSVPTIIHFVAISSNVMPSPSSVIFSVGTPDKRLENSTEILSASASYEFFTNSETATTGLDIRFRPIN